MNLRLFSRLKKSVPVSPAAAGAQTDAVTRVRVWPVVHAFGLDISDTSIEAMECEHQGTTLRLRSYNRVLLEKGVIVDGEITDPDRLQVALDELRASARPASFPHAAVVSLPESRMYMHTFEFPTSFTVKQIRSAITFEVEGVLPIRLEEMITDFVVHRSRDGSQQHVLFAAVPVRLVEQYMQALDRAGIEVVAFDAEAVATARALVGARSEPVLLIDIGGQRTTLLVVERGGVHGAVTLPLGGISVTEAIARAARLGNEEAEVIKMRSGLTDQTPVEVRASVEEQLKPLVHEIQQLSRAHQAHFGRTVQEIILAGGSALLPGLDVYLARVAERQVRVGDPFSVPSVQFPKTLSPEDIEWLQRGRLFFSTSVGLALRGTLRGSPERGVNLLPRARRARYLLWRENLTLTVLALLTVAAWTFLFLMLGISLLRAEFASRRLQAEAKPIRDALASARFSSASEQASTVNQEISLISAFSAEQADILPTAERIRAAIPLGIRLVGVLVEIAPGPQSSYRVRLRGVADTREQFLEFEQKIRHLPGVQSVESPLTNLDRPLAAPFALTLAVSLLPSPPSPSPSPVIP